MDLREADTLPLEVAAVEAAYLVGSRRGIGVRPVGLRVDRQVDHGVVLQVGQPR